jgi:hypothetical protein
LDQPVETVQRIADVEPEGKHKLAGAVLKEVQRKILLIRQAT